MPSQNPLPETVWNRHSNPRSGWSRLAVTPVFVYALYARRWKLLAVTVVFLVVNPVLFREPEEVPETDFMYRAVRGEELWLEEGRPLFGFDYPAVLNVFSAAGSAYALWSALRRRPVGTAVGTVVLMAAKLGFVKELGDHFETVQREQVRGS